MTSISRQKVNPTFVQSITGFILRYLIRFIEAPFLLILAVSLTFSIMLIAKVTGIHILIFWMTNLLASPVLGWNLSAFGDPSQTPDFSFEASEIIISAAFWLMIYHLFWEIGYALTRHPFFDNSSMRINVLSVILIISNLIVLFGFAQQALAQGIVGIIALIAMLTITATLGLMSLRASQILQQLLQLFEK